MDCRAQRRLGQWQLSTFFASGPPQTRYDFGLEGGHNIGDDFDRGTAEIEPWGSVSAALIGYSGNGSPGALTVSDGTHTANIAILGNYSLANFIASSDGHGGTSVVDPPLAGGNALYTSTDPAGSQAGLNQQVAMLSQSMTSFAPSDGGGGGTSEDAPLGYYAGQLPNLAQPVANQQHV